jgi:cytochrome d ubiquinol oxidase subunit II
LCGGYVLLGAGWLILRTEGALQAKARGWARWGLAWVALGVALVSLGTPFVSETVRGRWFDFPRTLGLMLLPLMTALTWAWIWVSLERSEWKPFAGAVAIYVLAFFGLAYSLFPYVVIDRMTIWEAAAHPSSLAFVLVGTLIVLPFIVGYTVYAYRVFRGKARAEDYGHGKYT